MEPGEHRGMNRHLREISEQAEKDSHAVVVLDGVGWYKFRDLDVASNFSLLFLSSSSPELSGNGPLSWTQPTKYRCSNC